MGVATGTILAAVVAIWAAIVVRGTKVSEWRQAWINGQRSDIASALAMLVAQSVSASMADAKQHVHEFEMAYNRICLRENPDHPEWQKLIRELDDLYKLVRTKAIILEDLRHRENTILLLGQKALKREWTRVRGGESGYRWFVMMGATITILAIYAFVLTASIHK